MGFVSAQRWGVDLLADAEEQFEQFPLHLALLSFRAGERAVLGLHMKLEAAVLALQPVTGHQLLLGA